MSFVKITELTENMGFLLTEKWGKIVTENRVFLLTENRGLCYNMGEGEL